MKSGVICLYRHLSQQSDLAMFHLLLMYWRELLILVTQTDNLNTSHSWATRMFLSVQYICLYKKKKRAFNWKRIWCFDMFHQIFMSVWLHRRVLKDRNSVPGAAADLLGDWGQVTWTCIFFSLHKMKITVLMSLVKCPEISGLPWPCGSLVLNSLQLLHPTRMPVLLSMV